MKNFCSVVSVKLWCPYYCIQLCATTSTKPSTCTQTMETNTEYSYSPSRRPQMEGAPGYGKGGSGEAHTILLWIICDLLLSALLFSRVLFRYSSTSKPQRVPSTRPHSTLHARLHCWTRNRLGGRGYVTTAASRTKAKTADWSVHELVKRFILWRNFLYHNTLMLHHMVIKSASKSYA